MSTPALGNDARVSPGFITSTDTARVCQQVLEATEAVIGTASTVSVKQRFLALRQKAILLRDEHNAGLPVAGLPAEVLAEIFLLHRARVVRYGFIAEDLSWIGVTHVCRYWRAVGLGCTTLWSPITFANRASVETMLRRSSTSPLSLHFTDFGRDRRYTAFVDSLPLALSQAHRVRSLKLHNIDGRTLLSAISSCVKGVPLLEHLSLICKSTDTWPTTEVGSLRSVAPALKTLYMSPCRLPWSDLPIPNSLVQLALFAPPGHPCRPSSESFVRSMRELHCLKVLVLDGYLPVDAYPPSPRPLLTMFRLLSLRLADSVDSISHFLQAIFIRNTENVEIKLKNCQLDREEQHMRRVIGDLKKSWSLMNNPLTPSRLLFPALELLVSEMLGSASWFMAVDSDPTSPRGMSTALDLSIETATPRLSQILLTFINEVDFSELTFLSINGIESSGWDEGPWCSLFSRPTKVTTILLGNNPSSITQAILGMLARKDSPLLFPFLLTIMLSETDIQTRKKDGVYRSLWGVLQARHISKLGVEECMNFGEKHAAVLKSRFPLDVRWDGFVDYTDSDGEDREDGPGSDELDEGA